MLFQDASEEDHPMDCFALTNEETNVYRIVPALQNKTSKSLKEKVHDILSGSQNHLEDPRLHRISICFEVFIVSCIILLVLISILNSDRKISENDEFIGFSNSFEIFALVIFTIEYLLRLWSSGNGITKRFHWAIQFLSIVDLMALISLYVDVFSLQERYKGPASTLRAFRGLRILLLFKIERQSQALKQLSLVFKATKEEMGICIVVMLTTIMVGSSVIFYFENEVQPDKFSSIAVSIYWSFVTITTVGYGDMHPVSVGGQITACVLSCIGVLVIAIPASILSSSFVEVINERKRLQGEKAVSTHEHQNHYVHSLNCETANVEMVMNYIELLQIQALQGDETACKKLISIHNLSTSMVTRLLRKTYHKTS